MVKCTFCGNELARGTGKMYVKKDGAIYYFCSMKCEKNLIKLKRKPIATRWSKLFRK
jgi:large subunit ribosomal protein L24e